MLDFKELNKDGNDFELLVRELLYNKGLEVYWSGKGPDGGKDLLCIERYQSCFKEFTRRWLVQCKHNAHSEKAVGISELGVIENSCGQHNADGYLLVCSTFPSAAVVTALEGIEKNRKITTAFWDCRALERQLLVPENWSIVNLFFPISSKRLGWQISKIDSYFWHANYNGNIFYFALRIGTNCDYYLKYIAERLDELESLDLPKNHYIRLRAVYFDDKYTNFLLYLDYLLPQGISEEDFDLSTDVINFCNDRIIEGVSYDVDLKVYEYNGSSDNFDLDHQSYYAYYISNFKSGMRRKKGGAFYKVFRDDTREFTEEIRMSAFNDLTNAFSTMSSIRVLKASNAKVENLAYFSDNFSWDDTINGSELQTDNFFSAEIRFECSDFDELCRLLSTFPTSVVQHFELEQHHIFLPDVGYAKDKDSLYTLKIMVHPTGAISKLGFRKLLNQYMIEITNCIVAFQNDSGN
ncbi:MAG: restriction endonuclease [Clostridiales bacterium]|nr:restriction endonuclease [Clostridiales bacterium]